MNSLKSTCGKWVYGMADVEFSFEDNTVKVLKATDDAIEAALLEAAAEIVSQTARNTRVDTGQLKGSWQANVNKTADGYEAVIGSPLENAIWEEFGTGEHALPEGGGGRKGYWVFVKGSSDSENSKSNGGKSYSLKEAKRVMAILRSKGLDAYYTNGKKPRRALWKAFNKTKPKIIKHFQDSFGAKFK